MKTVNDVIDLLSKYTAGNESDSIAYQTNAIARYRVVIDTINVDSGVVERNIDGCVYIQHEFEEAVLRLDIYNNPKRLGWELRAQELYATYYVTAKAYNTTMRNVELWTISGVSVEIKWKDWTKQGLAGVKPIVDVESVQDNPMVYVDVVEQGYTVYTACYRYSMFDLRRLLLEYRQLSTISPVVLRVRVSPTQDSVVYASKVNKDISLYDSKGHTESEYVGKVYRLEYLADYMDYLDYVIAALLRYTI
jgi:hypothetical protein